MNNQQLPLEAGAAAKNNLKNCHNNFAQTDPSLV
jgi:hypothetical protein